MNHPQSHWNGPPTPHPPPSPLSDEKQFEKEEVGMAGGAWGCCGDESTCTVSIHVPTKAAQDVCSILQESHPICDHQKGRQPSPCADPQCCQSCRASFEVWQLLLVSLKPLPCSHLVTAPCPHPHPHLLPSFGSNS